MINSMIIRKNSNIDLRFILSVINSRIITYWFNVTFQKFQRKTFPQFKVKELALFPIPKLDLKKSRDLKLYKEVISEVKKIERLLKNVDSKSGDIKAIQSKIEVHDFNIEDKLAELFKLSKKELHFIKNQSK